MASGKHPPKIKFRPLPAGKLSRFTCLFVVKLSLVHEARETITSFRKKVVGRICCQPGGRVGRGTMPAHSYRELLTRTFAIFSHFGLVPGGNQSRIALRGGDGCGSGRTAHLHRQIALRGRDGYPSVSSLVEQPQQVSSGEPQPQPEACRLWSGSGKHCLAREFVLPQGLPSIHLVRSSVHILLA